MCLAKRITAKPSQQKHQEPAATGGNVPDKADSPFPPSGSPSRYPTGTAVPPFHSAGRGFPSPTTLPMCPEETGAKIKQLYFYFNPCTELIPLALAKTV